MNRERDDGAAQGDVEPPIDVFAASSPAAMLSAKKAPRVRTSSDRSRAADDTSALDREDLDYYAPPNRLEVPTHPDYVYRWVSEYVNGSHMPGIVQMRLREGYTRVMIDQLPEDFLVDEDKGDGCARTGGLILMRMPARKHAARTNYYRRRSIERLGAANELQGVAGNNSVMEDRGTKTLVGADAGRALSQMARS
jgi:hypothetical protein